MHKFTSTEVSRGFRRLVGRIDRRKEPNHRLRIACFRGRWRLARDRSDPERLELKRSFYAELSELVRPDVILASNSSSYKSSAFADVTSHPERLMNAHFYGRPWRRPAVELMTCGSTDPVNIERVRLFFESCGLRPFVCRGESTAFLFNRIWHAVKQESLKVVAEGHATPAEIDELWRILMGSEPFGPFERMDRVGCACRRPSPTGACAPPTNSLCWQDDW